MKTFTRKDVARRVAKLLNANFNSTEKIVEEIFRSMHQILAEAENEVRIEIRGLGVFEVKKTNPKPRARNPKTGENVYIPAHTKIHFKAGKTLNKVLRKPLDTVS